MARLNKEHFKEKSPKHSSIQDIVNATYHSFILEGQKYFQIDSYGKANREIPGKVSQTMQFDKEFAEKLVILLKQEFQI
ncbi:MAG: hypothetical protein J1E80_09220 [Desulfovibrionaceae bacterium]|nr:hypothetical protein [Desulfovibrionaceae bacterium]